MIVRTGAIATGIFFIILSLSPLLTAPLRAQELSSRGRDFWMAFMPTNGADDRPRYEIQVTSAAFVRGTVTYMYSGRKDVILVQGGVRPLVLDLDSSQLIPPDVAQSSALRSVHLVFEGDVSIKAINMMRWSADAFLAIPTPALGMRYMVLSYPNTLDPAPGSATTGKSDFQSEFGVVATEDETIVRIIAPVPINQQTTAEPITVKLRAGEFFIGQAKGIVGTDLTGASIVATKPVAVYGGHVRGNVPYTSAEGRDHMVEQLPPIENWGREAIVTPHARLESSIADRSVVRVLASEDETNLMIDGITRRAIQRGEVYELPLDRAMVISADHPILVAEYHGSATPEGSVKVPTDSIGDPFMALVPAPSQFDTIYRFQSFVTPGGGYSYFDYHFINVVVRTADRDKLWLDGAHLESVEFREIPGSDYSYTSTRVGPGMHLMHAAVPFGVMAYGYGPYNSYGYPAGAIYRHAISGLSFAADASGSLTARAIPTVVRGAFAGVELHLPIPQSVTIDLVDMMGRSVRDVASDLHLESGTQTIPLDLTGLPAGIYYCRVQTESGVVVAKLIKQE